MHLLLTLATALLTAASPTTDSEQIRILPVLPTPEPSTVQAVIAYPSQGAVINNPVWIQFRVDGYSLGSSSQFDRADEIVVSDMGQTMHIVIDNQPYIPVVEPAIDPFNEDGFYYKMSFKFEVPYRLKEGMHTVRIFPARSFGEALKGERTFFAIPFYVGSEKNNMDVDFSKPYLTYNEPSDQLYLVESKPVLLDFYLSNCEMTPDGYKIRLTIDGKVQRMLVSWQPYYIYGLKKGKHTIHMELVDSRGVVVPGLFNSVQRTFTVH